MSAIRTGYKQTEVGVIPEDWQVALLGELATTSSGTTPARAQADRYFTNGTIRWVKTLDLTNGPISETEEAVTPAALAETCLQTYPIETVLVAMYGGYNQIGRTGLLEIQACVNQALTAIRTDRKKLAPRFLLNILNYRVDYWRTVASSSRKDPNITSNDIRSFSLAVPPIAEQEAIAEALSDADALIESLEQLLAKKRHLKQGAMQELLTGKKRLPGFSGAWAVKRLGECLSVRPEYGINAPAVTYSDRHPVYLRITDISDDGRFSAETRVSVDHSDASEYYLNDGDLVFARTGASVGKSYRYDPSDGPLVFAGFLIRVRPDTSALDCTFLAEFVKTDEYWNWVLMTSMRSGQPGINGKELERLPIPLPSIQEQTAIAAILSDMHAEIAELESQLAKTRNLKQGMMQKLLTGEIRLL